MFAADTTISISDKVVETTLKKKVKIDLNFTKLLYKSNASNLSIKLEVNCFSEINDVLDIEFQHRIFERMGILKYKT
ncbi:hypothetical protein BpHYR1_043145 [Brachionus plicatilis]|uniref:Uncharacterized protein n=1 Tax=Brachionus plicatilis TaxID=10195 RepID=A0A3M7R068_BRAPC|nr:hypothetical protein BpHYR1_043145 [Brachionus plicatilis]